MIYAIGKLKMLMCLRIKIAALVVILFSVSACKNHNTVFREVIPSESGVDFNNKLVYSDSLTVLDFEYMFNGAGVALCDINNDGLQDILFTGNMTPARLYLNKGNLKFEDITEKSGIKAEGWCYGIAVVDINQDGYQDFYIVNQGIKIRRLHKGIIIFSSTMATTHLQNPQQKWDWMMMATMYRLPFSTMTKMET